MTFEDLYRGKRVVVTGASSGIGKATARLLARLGAEVMGLDRQVADAGLAGFIAVDLADPGSIDSAVAKINGPVHGLFNCAGVSPTRPPADIFKVNLLGLRHLTDALADRMPSGAAIASTASNGGLAWRERLAEHRDLLRHGGFEDGLRWLEAHMDGISNAYSFAKEALVVWTMMRSQQLIARGVRINCISPGAVETPMLTEVATKVPRAAIDATTHPIGRRSSPEEQAWPLVWLNSELASYVNGADLPVDGGFAASRAVP